MLFIDLVMLIPEYILRLMTWCCENYPTIAPIRGQVNFIFNIITKFIVLIPFEYLLTVGNKIVISMMAAVDMAELLSLVGNVHSSNGVVS